MTVETIHDEFIMNHLLRFYGGSLLKDKAFEHRSMLGARIELVKMLTKRWKVRVTPEARALLIEDARDWALSDSVSRQVVGTSVYQYLTATAGFAVV